MNASFPPLITVRRIRREKTLGGNHISLRQRKKKRREEKRRAWDKKLVGQRIRCQCCSMDTKGTDLQSAHSKYGLLWLERRKKKENCMSMMGKAGVQAESANAAGGKRNKKPDPRAKIKEESAI